MCRDTEKVRIKKLKIDERTQLNQQHLELWDELLKLIAVASRRANLTIEDLERLANALERTQNGQRLSLDLMTGLEMEQLSIEYARIEIEHQRIEFDKKKRVV